MINIDCLLYVEDDFSNRLVMRLLVEKTLNVRYYAIFKTVQTFFQESGAFRYDRTLSCWISTFLHITVFKC
jgi:hypothetical protein